MADGCPDCVHYKDRAETAEAAIAALKRPVDDDARAELKLAIFNAVPQSVTTDARVGELIADAALAAVLPTFTRLAREKAEARDKALAEPRGVLASLEKHGGCGDGYCVIGGRAKGQHTNGGCKCYRDEVRVRLAFRALLAFRRALSPKPDTIGRRRDETD